MSPAAMNMRLDAYAQLAGKKITITVEDESGKTADVELDAAAALRDIDQRIATMKELQRCLRGHG